jgi:hypothetical protein
LQLPVTSTPPANTSSALDSCPEIDRKNDSDTDEEDENLKRARELVALHHGPLHCRRSGQAAQDMRNARQAMKRALAEKPDMTAMKMKTRKISRIAA